MNWLSKISTPGLKSWLTKRDTPENLWVKCPKSGELVYRNDLEENWYVTPAGAHLRISPRRRLRLLFDDERWETFPLPSVPVDPLKFKDDRPYPTRLKAAKTKTDNREKEETIDGGAPLVQSDCMAVAFGMIEGKPSVVLVQDFAFMGGSLGMAAGEAFIAAAEIAAARKAAFVVCTGSGGARMQEGTLSLMQMPRTILAIEQVRRAGLPYLVVLCDPTSGGVLASYAMLGDIHISEPGALLAFSGPRVIEQTIREKLPEGFQRSEFLQDKGQVDVVCYRRELKTVLGRSLRHLMHKTHPSVKLPFNTTPQTNTEPTFVPPVVD